MPVEEKRQVRALVRGLESLTERAVRKVTLDLHANLVEEATASVVTGWHRANFVPRVGQPQAAPVGAPENTGPAQAATQAGVSSVLAYSLGNGKVFVTNNVPYAEALNNGSSKRQPAGAAQRAIAKAIEVIVR